MSAATISAGPMVRTRRPNIMTTEQNSQSNGQPRENCTLIDAYRRKSASSHNGAGVW